MNPLLRMSLRYSLPLLIAAGFAVESLFSYLSAEALVQRDVESASVARVKNRMSEMQNELEDLLRHRAIPGVRSIITNVGASPEVKLVFLTDADGTVISSTDLSLIGRHWRIASAISDDEAQQIAGALLQGPQMPGTDVHSDPDEQDTSGVVPVCWETNAATLRVGPCGVLFYEEDYAREKRIAVSRLRIQAASGAAGTALIAVFLWLALHAILGRRVEKIAGVAKRFAAGESQARARLAGGDEIAGLAATVDAMLDEINRINAAVRKSEATLRAVTSALPDFMFIASPEGRVLSIHGGTEACLHPDAGSLAGKTFGEFLPKPEARKLRESAAAACGGEMGKPTMTELRLYAGGRWRVFEIHIACVVLPDNEKAAVLLSRDITVRKDLEKELRASKQEAEFASQTKSTFLANMSHELRTPLNAILGFSEMMKRQIFGPMGDARYAGYASDIYKSGAHLLGIINDILDISKVEAGRLQLHEEDVSLEEIVESAARFFGVLAENKKVALGVSFETDLPRVQADPMRLKQILINLVSNAVKFTPAGGRVDIDCHGTPAGGIAIEVRDTGIGMTEEEIKVALQPFKQIDSTMVRRHEGTGLGLPLAAALTELHGGALRLESKPKVGTSAVVTLPADRIVPRPKSPSAAVG